MLVNVPSLLHSKVFKISEIKFINMDFVDLLSIEISEMILCDLPVESVLSFCQTCKKARDQTMTNERLWKNFCKVCSLFKYLKYCQFYFIKVILPDDRLPVPRGLLVLFLIQIDKNVPVQNILSSFLDKTETMER